MATKTNNPTVFISYSWEPIQNKNQVVDIAKKLLADGIDVILDEWSLVEGQDKYDFMEKMVNDKSVTKVLIFSNKTYMEKANDKKGGVGTESLILSDEIYNQAEQTKYIPIVMEYDDKMKPCLPTFLKSRKYLDFSDEQKYQTDYKKLVLILFGKPVVEKPPLGSPPPFVLEESETEAIIVPRIEELKLEILRNQPFALTENYYNDFLKKFDDFGYIRGGSDHFDDMVIKSINDWTPLRDNFIDFFSVIIESDKYFNIESFHSFLEKSIKYVDRPEGLTSWHGYEWDNYKFMLTELFLHISATLINKEKYEYLSYILKKPYLIEDYNTGKYRPLSFAYFENYITSLDDMRNKRLALKRVSVTADLLTERANIQPIDKKIIIETDLLLYFLSIFHYKNRKWTPRCSVYWRYRSTAIGILNKLVSRDYFEKIKTLFDVENIDDLKTKLDSYASNEHNWRVGYPLEVPPIKSAFNYDEIGKFD